MAKRKRKRLRRIIITVVVLAILGAIFLKPKKQDLLHVTVDPVQKRDITATATATGSVQPEVEVDISSEVAGEIVELPVKEGDTVKKGQLLARVNPEVLQSQVSQEEAALESNRAQAQQLKVQYDRLKQVETDKEELFKNEFISEDSLKEARAAADAGLASYEAAKARIHQQEMALAQARENLSKATIYSPMDGVVSSLSAELGERVVGTGQFEGTQIMRVANFSVMELLIEVNETDVINISVDDTAIITLDALPDESFQGHVSEIAASAKEQTSTEDPVVFEVTLRIDQPDERIRPGMTATAEIETDSVTGVLAVPLQSVAARDKQTVAAALGKPDEAPPPPVDNVHSDRRDKKLTREQRQNIQRVVFVIEDGVAKLRTVETGISDTRYMEIKSGVKEGDKVVSGPYSAISRELSQDKAVTVDGPNGNGGDKKGPPQS